MGSSLTRGRILPAGPTMFSPPLFSFTALVFVMLAPGIALAQVQDLTVALNGVTYSGISASLLASQFPAQVQTIAPAAPSVANPPFGTDDDGDDDIGDSDDDDIAAPLPPASTPEPTSPIASSVPVDPFTVTLLQTPTDAAGAPTGSPSMVTYTIGTAGANTLDASSGASGTMEMPFSSSGLSNGARIGIGVGVGIGGAILIALLAFAAWFIFRRRKMQNDRNRLAATNVPTYRGAELSPVSEAAEKDAERFSGSNGGVVVGLADSKKEGHEETRGDVGAPRQELPTSEMVEGRVELPAREVPMAPGDGGGSLRSDI